MHVVDLIGGNEDGLGLDCSIHELMSVIMCLGVRDIGDYVGVSIIQPKRPNHLPWNSQDVICWMAVLT